MSPQLLLLLAMLLPQSVEGPISDAISKRFDTLGQRIEAWQNGSTLQIEKLQEAQASRFAELFQGMRAAAEERQGILKSIAELRAEREGLFAGLKEFRQDRDGILAKLSDARAEIRAAREEFAPLRNLAKRGLWLVLYLAVLIAALVLLVELAKWAFYRLLRSLFSFSIRSQK